MRKILLIIPVLIFFTTCSAYPQSQEQKFDNILNQYFKSNEPGAAVLIAKGDKVLYKKSIGVADMELNVPVTTEMVFRIGSITKQFTSAAILQLAEKGKLSLQDDIKKFIPDYPTQGYSITIEHLLTHTSGIKSFTSMPEYYVNMRKDLNREEVINVFKDQPMDFAPGTKWLYDNSGYFLLGYIIEKLSGQTYAEYVKQHLFEPAGMMNSYYGDDIKIIKNRAKGYGKLNGNYENANYLSMTQPFAAGALLSTIEDLWKWNRALHSSKILPASWLEKAQTPYKLSDGKSTGYGYGWMMGDIKGSRTIWHNGAINGFLSESIFLPDEDVFVVLFANCLCFPLHKIAERFAATAIGKPSE